LITFQYFDGCPNAKATLENLLSLKAELGIPESEIELVEVPDPSLAEEFRFQGSPTILVNGRDIATGEEPYGFSYTCRVYFFDGTQTGVIPKEYIRRKLLEYREGYLPGFFVAEMRDLTISEERVSFTVRVSSEMCFSEPVPFQYRSPDEVPSVQFQRWR